VRIASWKSTAGVLGGIVGIAVLLSATTAPPKTAAQPAAQEITLQVDPVQSHVHYSVDSTLHTVHGTFTLKDGTVRIDPVTGKADGEVAVYATSGDSGNQARDERMHKEILETGKYPDAIFRPTQVEGAVTPSGASDVKLQGILLLHGGEHPIVAKVHAELSGDHWRGIASFDVPYIQWGIKNPSTWLLKVKPVVAVELDLAGTASIAK
jgi:polyisoprenoid-binding protein YceI